MTRRHLLVSAASAASAQTVHDEIREMAAGSPLAMRFQGKTAAEARGWQSAFRARLDVLLGSYAPPQRFRTERIREVDCGGFRRHELLLRARGHRDLPVHLLVPQGASRGQPGILALHGHGEFAHDSVAGIGETPEREAEIADARYDYGRQLALRGYVVAAPCFTPFGPRLGRRQEYRGEDPCAVTFVRMQLFGRILLSENLRDALWALELLSSHELVDAERLGCVGFSLGGRMTMMAASVSPRIKAAVISGALNVLQERVMGRYSCGAQIIPGLLLYGDVPEIAALIAPRPCLWEVGRMDPLMVKDWIDPALERMRPVWKALGAPANLAIDSFDGAHRWNGDLAYPLLEQALRR